MTAFFPLDMRTGVIENVENHPNADRLYVLKVNLRDEERQLVAGLREYYQPDELLGKRVVVLCNLKPANIRGVESQGMVLAADDGNRVALLTTDAACGTRVLPEDEVQDSNFGEISIDEFMSLDLRIKDGVACFGDVRLVANGHEVKPDKDVREGARIR